LGLQALKLTDTARVIKMSMECDFNCVKYILLIQGQIYVGVRQVYMLTYIFSNDTVDVCVLLDDSFLQEVP
jgi:hypothetical protein